MAFWDINTKIKTEWAAAVNLIYVDLVLQNYYVPLIVEIIYSH